MSPSFAHILIDSQQETEVNELTESVFELTGLKAPTNYVFLRLRISAEVPTLAPSANYSEEKVY